MNFTQALGIGSWHKGMISIQRGQIQFFGGQGLETYRIWGGRF